VIISKEILETAKNTIKIEHQAIMQLIDVIDEKFVAIVELPLIPQEQLPYLCMQQMQYMETWV
jgi:hypothetical protein